MNLLLILIIAVSVVYTLVDMSSWPLSLNGIAFPALLILGALTGCLMLKRKEKKEMEDRPDKFTLTFNLLFLLFFMLLVLEIKKTLYYRNVWFLVYFSTCVCLITAEILFSDIKRHRLINLLKSFSLMLLSRYALLAINLKLPQTDVWYHEYEVISKIIQNGFIPEVGYRNWPLMHIFISICRLITGIDAVHAYWIFSIPVQALTVVALFYFCRNFLNLKMSLFSSAILCFMPYFFKETYSPLPSALALFFITCCLLCVFKAKEKKNYLPLALILLATIIIAHSLNSFIFAQLLLLLGLYELARLVMFRKKIDYVDISIIFFFSLMTYWVYATGYWYSEIISMASSAISASAPISIDNFETFKNPSGELPTRELSDFIVTYVPYFLGGVIIYIWGKKDESSTEIQKKFVIFSFVYLSFVFTISVIGSDYLMFSDRLTQLLPERWHPILDIFTASIFSGSLLMLFRGKSNVLIIPFIFLLSFFYMLNCSQDVSLFSVHPISFTYKESEISSVEKIDSKSGSFNVDIMCDVLCKNCTAFYDVKTTLDSSFLLRKGLSEVLPIKKDSEDIAGRASKTITLNSTYYGYRDKVLENKEVVLFD